MRSRLVVAALLVATGRANAQGVSLETLATGELLKTDGGSRLLAIDSGGPAFRGQIYAWLAYQPTSTFRVLALGELYGITGKDHALDGELQGISVRWWHSRAVRIEAGKILLPIGEFAARRFATVNPLIGAPDTYVDTYPWGVSVSGAAGTVDYTAAAVTLPAVNERYSPAPGSRFRPVLGVGFTAGPQLRVGLGATHGPYLGAGVRDQLPDGANWQRFSQTVITGDLRFSRGRFDTRAEMIWSQYDVPTVATAVRGLGWYFEWRATLSPRIFIAARYERNRYPFVMPVSQAFWVGTSTTQMNGELGVGYRLSAEASLKASFRRDHWPVHEASGVSFPDGYALGVQGSVHTDVVGLLRRKP
jgi:hypothetical protein